MRILFLTGLFSLIFCSSSSAQTPEGWYRVGIRSCKITYGYTYNVTWRGSSQWGEDTTGNNKSITSILYFDEKLSDGKMVYYEYNSGDLAFEGKFIFDDNSYDSGTYLRKDGNEYRFSRPDLLKDH